MLKLNVIDGIENVTVTLFDAVEKLLGMPTKTFIENKSNVSIANIVY